MTETLVLKAQKREHVGTGAARKQRAQGLVPAIIYGHKQEPVAALLSYHDLALEIQHRHRLLEVELDGKVERFLLKDVQYDHLGDTIIHVDLTRVDMDERVNVTVEVILKGTPVGLTEGGTLDRVLTEVELECLVTDIPENIRVDIRHLKLGDSLLAGDLELPGKAKLLTEAESLIATVRLQVAKPEEEEKEEAVEEAEAGEPEVITREKSEGEEQENEQ